MSGDGSRSKPGSFGRGLREGWLAAARRVSAVPVQAALVIMYYVLAWPLAVWLRRVADPLRVKPRAPSPWTARDPAPPSLERMREQF
jgi:hypothetical protein